jgi:hypothetical protein
MGSMAKRAGKANNKAAPKRDRAWFEGKVAELKAELEKLPADRQEQLSQDLEAENRTGAPRLVNLRRGTAPSRGGGRKGR